MASTTALEPSPTTLPPEPAPPAAAPDHARSEAFRELQGLARRAPLDVPPDLLAAHVLSVTAEAGFAVQRAAMEAVVRRLAFAERDELVVARRPKGSRLGVYETRRRGQKSRAYTTELTSLAPLRGSCDCPDYRKSSLGLCKHLLVVLSDLARRPGLLAAEPGTPPSAEARLVWDPVRPLRGPGDFLERVRLRLPASSAKAPPALRPWLTRREPDGLAPERTWPDDARRRRELVEALLAFLGRGEHAARRSDPALRVLLAAERERLVAQTHRAARTADFRSALRTLRRKLYPYQTAGVQRFLETGSLLLADDMGLGKTAQAIAGCHALFTAAEVRRGLLIVPASLKSQWLREWGLFTGVPVEVVDGSPEERRAFYRRKRPGFLIANYEQALKDLDAMRAYEPQVLVLDEAQRIKNWATKTATCVKELQAPWRLVLTGTPMENRLTELASVLDVVDEAALEPKWRLVPLHSVFADGTKEITGVRNLDTLRQRMAHCLLRRLRKDVLAQLPARTDTVVPVAMTPDQVAAHQDLDLPIRQLLAVARRRPLTQAEFLKLMRLMTTQRMIANGMAQLEFADAWPEIEGRPPSDRLLEGLRAPKLGELREIVQSLVVDQGRKAVIFSQWRRMLQLAHWAVSDLLARCGCRALFFTGQEGQRRRTQNVVDFHDDPSARILFATDAGGVGLNLQRAANVCINIDLPWNPAVLEQRIGRIHRLGQESKIDVYNLVSEGSIEARIAGLVADKRALFTGLFDGTSDEVRFDSSGRFLDQIEQIYDKPAALPQAATPGDDDQIAAETAADVTADDLGPVAATAPPPLATADLGALFAQLAVQRDATGTLRIEAPPAAATTLASVLEGLAAVLRQAAPPPSEGRRE